MRVPESCRAQAWVTIDGHTRIDLRQGDHLNINASSLFIPCKFPLLNRFSCLMEKR